MEIIVNGEPVKTTASTLSEYLQTAGIDPGRVAVELNREIVPKKEYPETVLNEGDKIEIVQFVGGG